MENTFFATLFRMKYISRWGLMRCNFGENLSEHSLEVAFLAHALALIGNQVFGKAYDCGAVCVKAMYHDAPEILTGDLPTPVKYYNAETKKAMTSWKKRPRRALPKPAGRAARRLCRHFPLYRG